MVEVGLKELVAPVGIALEVGLELFDRRLPRFVEVLTGHALRNGFANFCEQAILKLGGPARL